MQEEKDLNRNIRGGRHDRGRGDCRGNDVKKGAAELGSLGAEAFEDLEGPFLTLHDDDLPSRLCRGEWLARAPTDKRAKTANPFIVNVFLQNR